MPTRRVAVLLLAVGLVFAAGMRPAQRLTRQEQLTEEINNAPQALQAARSADERQQVYDRIEAAKHELGPTDAGGKRVHPAAMWRDQAIGLLEADLVRFQKAPKAEGPAALAAEARGQARRMALVCIKRGWADASDMPKYQFDAFAQYLVNNLATLDAFFNAAAAWTGKGSGLPEGDARIKAWADAVKQIKDGVAALGQAYQQFTTTDPADRRTSDNIVGSLGVFAEGLAAMVEADAALKELAARKNAAAPEAGGTEPAAPQDLLDLSDEEKGQLAKVRAVAATLTDEGWASTKARLETFAAIAEKGLQVPQTRPQALELLRCIHQAAAYIDALTRSKSVFPDFLVRCQAAVDRALRYVERKEWRESGYSAVRRMYEGHDTWEILDASPLSPEACVGYLKAPGAGSGAFSNPLAAEVRRSINAVVQALDAIGGWDSEKMYPPLKPFYAPFLARFMAAAEEAGKAPMSNVGAWGQKHAAAGAFALDLRLLMDADRAVGVASRYVPARATEIGAQFVSAAAETLQQPAPSGRGARRPLQDFVEPFRALGELEVPGPADIALATKLTGGAYGMAEMRLRKQLGESIDEAAKGSPYALDQIMEARWMFRLLKRRCILEKRGLTGLALHDLYAFSMPDKDWKRFVESLDASVRSLFIRYVSDPNGFGPGTRQLGAWEDAYYAISAAQEENRRVRSRGTSELEALVANLTKVADPAPADPTWFPWAVGYHMSEAAVSLMAGYPGTAGWHENELARVRRRVRYETEYTWADLEEKAPAKPGRK